MKGVIMKKKNNLIRCLLALLCLFRIFMPAAIMADGEGDMTISIVPENQTQASGTTADHDKTVHVNADYGDVTELNIGSIEVVNDPDGDNTYGYALEVSASDGYTATAVADTVVLDKDSKHSGYYYGVRVDVEDGGHADVTTGDVTVENITKPNNYVTGVGIDVDTMFGSGSSAQVKTGNIVIDNGAVKPAETGLDVSVSASPFSADTASANVQTKNISVNNGDGVHAVSRMDGATLEVQTGNITAQNGNGVRASSTLSNTLVKTQDVAVNNGNGLNGYAIGQSQTTINGGDVTVTYGTGIKAEAINNGSVTITADSVTVEGEGTAIEVNAKSRDLLTEIDAVPGAGSDIDASDMSEKVSVIVNGDVEGKTGISLDGDSTGNIDILIDGTLKAEKSVSFTESVDLTNTSLTVWKIEQEAPADDTLNEVINYIVRIEKGSENIFDVIKTSGDPLNIKHDYNVANISDILVLSVKEGYTIRNAYNNGSKLEKDEQGRFILNVPFGGGISFSVDYDIDPDDPDVTPSVDPSDEQGSSGEQIVVRFVPPTTGVDSPFIRSKMMNKIVVYTLDVLIISLFVLSFNGTLNRKQFFRSLPDSLR